MSFLPDDELTGYVDEVVREGAEWRVVVHGVYWKAVSEEPVALMPGDLVYVMGRRGIKLIISPES